jgi:phage/plasmid primase-like uncharacterized protein
LADLSKILDGPWSPPKEKILASPESQLKDAMVGVGLQPPDELIFDGKIHRFRSGTKGAGGHDKPGWYLIFGDGVPAGRFGCWRSGIDCTFRADVGRKLSVEEEMAHTRRLSEARAIRDAELAKKHEIASETVETIWVNGSAASPDHPYLKLKGIGAHGSRVTGDGRLMVPLYGADGKISSIQYIDIDGGKLYHPGGQTGGKFWMIGTMDEKGTIYIAEGFATAATIHEATKRPCIVAYSASNLVPVMGSVRDIYGQSQDVVIIADHDQSGVGQRYAEQAAAKYGARMVMPPVLGDANDYAQSGHDLYALLNPTIENWLIPADEFCSKPAPISWLVKNWIQNQALIMVHGPSGGGKTFIVLDWCLRIAANISDWFGHKVKNGNVVYLAGEGHHGLRGRVAAWKHHHQAEKINMWLSKDGCDLNTQEGYFRVKDSVRALDKEPLLIVVDTLHRFLSGDENSAQDAKTMLDACNNLMQEFNCSVVLVHHTGVSDEAQHRARGSSAWRGALDIEISVVPGKDGHPMSLLQRKSKDSEIAKPLFANLEQVSIPGWLDEDGIQVTSAVIVQSEAPVPPHKKDSDNQRDIRKFTNAWWASGAEEREEKPYLSRDSFIKYLMNNEGLSESTAKTYAKESKKGRLIYNLLNNQTIVSFENGWLVCDEITASTLLLRKVQK